MPRLHCPGPLASGQSLELPAGAARHVQVLRLQPGDAITLFNGGAEPTRCGGEFEATIEQIGRREVWVRLGAHHPVEREAATTLHLALGMPANDRMDWLVEKATELGVTSIQPLVTERSVLRLTGERAEKKVLHWQSVAVAACEQCGGNRVPLIHPVMTYGGWLRAQQALKAGERALLLSLRPGALALRRATEAATSVTFLSGPEGGLSPIEEETALSSGFAPVSLGPRVLRAETAALCALAAVLLQ